MCSRHSAGGRAPSSARRLVLRYLAVLSMAVVLSSACTGDSGSGSRLPPPSSARPNALPPSIVLIVTDDQRWDTLHSMPTVRRALIGRGVTFPEGFVVNPECCPSRASILTGRYSHSTGVYTNRPDLGIRAFNDRSTLATWLDGAGYRTGLVGKYLNHYEGEAIPPGWDAWAAFSGPNAYYDYTLNEDGTLRSYGSGTASYATDVLAERATSFIRSTPTETPLFLYFAPFAPHSPSVAAERHDTRVPELAPLRPPSHNEVDVSDKPGWVRELPFLSEFQQRELDLDRLQEHQALLGVDDAVGDILAALRLTGRLPNTAILYMSDNGRALGEHRLTRKWAPYEEIIRIPFVLRYDPLASEPRTDRNLVTNIDVAPTLAELGGALSPAADGRSLVPLLEGTSVPFRRRFLIEHLFVELASGYPNAPTYCAVRSQSRLYVRYETGEEELYLLRQDPYQLTNRAGDLALEQQLGAMRDHARRMCRPRPPGMPPF